MGSSVSYWGLVNTSGLNFASFSARHFGQTRASGMPRASFSHKLLRPEPQGHSRIAFVLLFVARAETTVLFALRARVLVGIVLDGDHGDGPEC